MGVLRKITKVSVGIDSMRPRYETGNSQYEVELLNTRPLLLFFSFLFSTGAYSLGWTFGLPFQGFLITLTDTR
jgi:hypothetical protein